jgi:hypothetical protein
MSELRESIYTRFVHLAYAVARVSLPRYAHAKSPHRYMLPQLAACVLLSIRFNKSYRDTEELLLASDELRTALELVEVPNYATLSRTFKKIRLQDWNKMQTTLLDAINDGEGVQEEYVAVDSTYFAPTQASSTFLSKAGRKHTHYYTGAYAVGIVSQLILAVRTGKGPSSDMPYLKPLRTAARKWGLKLPNRRYRQIVLADKGFDGRDVKPGDLIPVIRRNNAIRNPQRIARAELVTQARLDGQMGQRWKVETVNSVIKRKFGEFVRSRSERLRIREAAAKALVYNLHVLVAFFQTTFCSNQTTVLTS